MPDPNGFLRYERQLPKRRPVPVRILDWHEVYPPASEELVRDQATRCMDCGIPFCHEGCPLGNRIPDWNDLVRTGAWAAAAESLHATNNFPEFTGRLCPAPCEAACVLGISDTLVTNVFAQAGKCRVPAIVFACDTAPELETEAPKGMVKVYPRPIDLENRERLGRFDGVTTVDSIVELSEAIAQRRRKVAA